MAMGAQTCLQVTLALTLFIVAVHSQTCADDFGSYASDFPAGSKERWLYENVAPGAECIRIARTQTEADKCNEFVFNVPDDEWFQLQGKKLIDPNATTLVRKDVEPFLVDNGHFPLDVCIESCRIRSWCNSVVWNYDFDKCQLNLLYGQQRLVDVAAGVIKTYAEKPRCPQGELTANTSLSYFRLGLKLFASMRYEQAAMMMEIAMETDKYHMMNYWGYSITMLVANDFSQDAIDQVKMKLAEMDGLQLPEISEYEQEVLAALTDAVFSSDVLANLAANYMRLYTDGGQTDYFAAIIAVIANKKRGMAADVKDLLNQILQKDSSNTAALTLYLHEYALTRESLSAENAADVITFVTNLRQADPNNILTNKLAVVVFYNLNSPEDVISLLEETLGQLPSAVSMELITFTESQQIREMVLRLAFISSLHRYDINLAEEILTKVETASDDGTYSVDTRAIFKALLYRANAQLRMKSLFAGTFAPQLPSVTIDSIVAIDASNDMFTVNKLSQYMYRQALVTQQIRSGTFDNYMEMVDKWEKLLTDSPSFDSMYSAEVEYNLNILRAEYSVMQDDREGVLGNSGYLQLAYENVANVKDEYKLMDISEMLAYSVKKLSENHAAPIGREPERSNRIPNDLKGILNMLERSWPNNTPAKVFYTAWIYRALGDLDMSRAVLDEAKLRLHQAKLDWLDEELKKIADYDKELSPDELGDMPISIPDSLTWIPDSDDMEIYDGLDRGWNWRPDVSALEPCMAYLYLNRDNSNNVWPTRENTTLMSTDRASHFPSNMYTCKQRCLFEKRFSCKAFTFGFNRCILHGQSFDEVSSDMRFEGVADETLYELPPCPQGQTNAYSQLILGGKAMSNGLVNLAEDKFSMAIALDPLMSMPKILKALLLFHTRCPTKVTEAGELLNEEMLKTSFEMELYNYAKALIDGQPFEDALNDLQDALIIKNDSLVSSILARQEDQQPLANPMIAASLIYKIEKENFASDADIMDLQQLSPKSPLPRLYKAYQLFMQAKWSELVISINAINTDGAGGAFLEWGDDSSHKHLAAQLKHYALIQRGKLSEAEMMYNSSMNGKVLSAYMYATRVFVDVLNVNDMSNLLDPEVIADADDCYGEARVVSRAMKAIKTYMDPNIDVSRKTSMENSLGTTLASIKGPSESFKQIWKNVSAVFYRINNVDGRNSAQRIANADVMSQSYLSPQLVRGLGVQLIHPNQLLAWASLISTSTWTTNGLTQVETWLNAADAAMPRRTVTLWLKYMLYRQWREFDDSHREESIAVAKSLVEQLSQGDRGVMYKAAQDYSKYPDPSANADVKTRTMEEVTGLPDWAIYLIIGLGALIIIVLIISCIVCLTYRRKKLSKGDKLYSGSIHSASSFGHSEIVSPQPGEVMYSGQKNDGFSYH